MRFAVASVFLICAISARPDPPIRLKSRAIDTSVPHRAALPRHYILQFRANPDPAVRAELARRGIRVLNAVPDSALMVSSATPPDLNGLDLSWAGPLAASDKLSRELAGSRYPAYLVIFHPDISAAEAREIADQAGFWTLDHPDLLPSHLLVTGSYNRLRDLAARDEVAFILPASTDLVAGRRVIGCAGALTSSGPVGAYVEVSSGWSQNPAGRVDLRYAFQSLTPKIEENAERNEVSRALAEWARYTSLDFSPGSDPFAVRAISLLFARGAHGDAYPFDGLGNVLAHTFYPAPPNNEPIAGDMHLDADENWQVGADIDLFSVVLHEAGHALGLGHTDRPDSVMYPYYRRLSALSEDDIAGIRHLYGDKNSSGPAPRPQPPAPPAPANPTAPPRRVPDSDRTPPTLRITSPALTIVATSSAVITLRGSAAGKTEVTSVTWSNSTGGSGPASGTASWSARVPLLVGTNVVIIRAYDAAGNSAWRAVTVVRR